MKRVFTFKKGEVSEDLVDTNMMDFLLDHLLDNDNNIKGGFPTYRHSFKVTINIEKVN